MILRGLYDIRGLNNAFGGVGPMASVIYSDDTQGIALTSALDRNDFVEIHFERFVLPWQT